MKRILRLSAAIIALILMLTACGGASQPASAKTEEPAKTAEAPAEKPETPAKTEEPAKPEEPAKTEETKPAEEPKAEPVQIGVGVYPGDEVSKSIWESVREKVAEEGVDLVITEAHDPNTMNNMFYDGGAGIDIVTGLSESSMSVPVTAIGYSTVTPIRIYSSKYKSVDEIKKGDLIYTNSVYDTGIFHSTRYQKFFAAAGLIELKRDPAPDFKTSDFDELVELIPVSPQDIRDKAAEMGTVIYSGKINVEGMESIFEDPTVADEENWLRFFVRASDAKDPARVEAFGKIVEAYQSQETVDILTEAGSLAQPAGWDVDLISAIK